MKRFILSSLRFFSCLLLVSLYLQASAHHSTNGIYHEDQVIEVSGTVKEWRFINPHPYLTLEVEAENGSLQEWDISFGGSAVTHLRRRGYTAETFTPGETIIVRGNPAKAEGVYGLLVERQNPRRGDGASLF